MKRIYFLIMYFFGLSFTAFPQIKTDINPEFYGTWLRNDYYQDIKEGKKPYELYSKMKPIMQFYFSENSDKTLMGSFAEGWEADFTKKSYDTLIINYNYNVLLTSLFKEKEGSETKLMVVDGNEKIVFKTLQKKYYNRNGVDWFINDKFISGDYITVSDSSKHISFSYDGNVTGIENFNKYRIPLFGTGIPWEFNTVILQEINKKVLSGKILHWRHEDDKLVLYNLTNIEGPNKKIVDKYLELIKIKPNQE